MQETGEKQSLFSYLDKALGDEGIKTASKFDVSIDTQSAMMLAGVGIGLIIFSHLLGLGIQMITRER